MILQVPDILIQRENDPKWNKTERLVFLDRGERKSFLNFQIRNVNLKNTKPELNKSMCRIESHCVFSKNVWYLVIV